MRKNQTKKISSISCLSDEIKKLQLLFNSNLSDEKRIWHHCLILVRRLKEKESFKKYLILVCLTKEKIMQILFNSNLSDERKNLAIAVQFLVCQMKENISIIVEFLFVRWKIDIAIIVQNGQLINIYAMVGNGSQKSCSQLKVKGFRMSLLNIECFTNIVFIQTL